MIGDRIDRLIVKALVVLGYPFDAWFLPADRNVRKAMRGEYQAPEWVERPAAGDAAGMSEGAAMCSKTPAPSRPEPTEELLLAAANWLDEYSRHLHFNIQRQDYLCGLVRDLRDRATLFAQNR